MAKRNWKRVQPRDPRDAMDLCTQHALEKHNRSIETVASLMGLASKWTLYKYIQEASLPLRMIKNFEHACGIDLVSRHLAASGNKLVINIPIGKQCDADDLMQLQQVVNDAVGALLRFYDAKTDVPETLAAVQTAIEGFAWHRVNVQKSHQPELPFEEE